MISLFAAPPSVLTDTETEILRLLAAGYNTPQIARLMNRNLNTVRTHIRNAAVKLEAHGRSDLLARARVLGAIDAEDDPSGS
jgi:LuxR family maltose regulon positive regulatory protein